MLTCLLLLCIYTGQENWHTAANMAGMHHWGVVKWARVWISDSATGAGTEGAEGGGRDWIEMMLSGNAKAKATSGDRGVFPANNYHTAPRLQWGSGGLGLTPC